MFIDQAELLRKTDGGLDIILWRYPEAQKAVDRPKTKFKIRATEKTASATLTRAQDGTYIVTDFGGDGKGKNAIAIVMHEEGCDFKTALQIICERFNITGDTVKVELPKAVFEKLDATTDQEEGEYYFDVKDVFTESELKEIFADKVVAAVISDARMNNKGVLPEDPFAFLRTVLKKYHCFSLNSFTQIKNRKALVTKSTDQYPVFMFDYGTWKKIYQPRNPEKQFRFRYVGERPKDFIFGLDQCVKDFNALHAQDDPDETIEETEAKEAKPDKLPHIINCSGDRDAMNVAAMHYNVIWLNSESAKLSWKQYTSIVRLTDNFYNLPDIDTTGVKQAHELSLEYLDLKTILLPEALKEKKDFRGNACKDVRDYLRYWSKRDFDDLVKTALPYKFWDEAARFNKKGKFIGYEYEFNNVQCYNFLQQNGFFRYKQENQKDGYIYIHVEGNTVYEIEQKDVRDYVNGFLRDRKMDIKLRNTFYKTPQLNESSLSNLSYTEMDFVDYDKHSQHLFFKNRTWRVTKEGIEDLATYAVQKRVWSDEVIDHRVELLQEPFAITFDLEKEEYDIEINNPLPKILNAEGAEVQSNAEEWDGVPKCLFFQYLINASRVHWRKEYEKLPEEENWTDKMIEDYKRKYKFSITGPNLTAEEIKEQKHHLCNKIYSLGYLLHRYKDMSKTWAPWAMDYKIADSAESHGGSGKSIAFKAVTFFMKHLTFDGRNQKLTDNPHLLENVTRHHDYLLVDDCHEYIKFDFFFSKITGAMDVNPKNNKQFTIPFEEAPKMAFTTNFGMKKTDPSTERRLLYSVFSDYYHYNKDAEYKETRQVSDDFGKNLFQDFTPAEWNQFINFMAYCLKWYLNYGKIDPPMDNVTKRNLQAEMGMVFQAWADTYFSEESGKRDVFVVKKDAFKLFRDETKADYTMQRFTKALKSWCKYHRFSFDPEALCNKSGRIIRKAENVATEMIFIQTKPEIDPEFFAEGDLPY